MIDEAFQAAIEAYWASRTAQATKQAAKGTSDTGARGSVTGGIQMAALENLVVAKLKEVGLTDLHIFRQKKIELPGYFRPEKKWDLVVVSEQQLVAALEFKSQVGPSFGNNTNNRAEEAIGNAVDIWTAYREGLFGASPRPFIGYFFLLEDCPKVHKAVKVAEPHFKADPIFEKASYARRYELLCRRLILERHYDAACLTLSTRSAPIEISHPSNDLGFERFIRELQAAACKFC